MVPGGAMDTVASRLANALVGNAPDEAVLEITLLGPELAFESAALVALCGADMDARAAGVPLPAEVSFEQACLIPNTIGPVVKACSGRAGIRAGENVLIIGAGGGMGLHAIQAARACGGRVIAAIRSNRTAAAARDAGADVVFSTQEHDTAQYVKGITDGLGADVVLDFVAQRDTLPASINAVAPAGRLVIMGYFPKGGVLETPTWLFTEEITVTGNRSAGRQDIADTVSAAREIFKKLA